MKTAILLQPPIASYAHAASRQRTMLRLTPEQVRIAKRFLFCRSINSLFLEVLPAVILPSDCDLELMINMFTW